jgi:hypothetical protein
MPDLSPPNDDSSQNELMHQWLDNQRHDLQVQSQRIALSEKELEHNRSLSEKTIEAQLKDRSENIQCTRSILKQLLIFFGIVHPHVAIIWRLRYPCRKRSLSF